MNKVEKLMEMLGLIIECINRSGVYTVKEIDIDNTAGRVKYIFKMTDALGFDITGYLAYSRTADVLVSDMASGIIHYIPRDRMEEIKFVLFGMDVVATAAHVPQEELKDISLTERLLEYSAQHDDGTYVPDEDC